MDLSNITISQESITIELVHPVTDEPIKSESGKVFTWSVFGADSKKYAGIIADKKRKYRKSKKVDIESEDTWEMSSELLAELTDSFYVVMDGKDVKPTTENANKILSDRRFKWLREQVEKAVYDRAGFIKG